MKCPHCLENFNASTEQMTLFYDQIDSESRKFGIKTTTCSNEDCKGRIIFLRCTHIPDNSGMPPGLYDYPTTMEIMVHPKVASRGIDLHNVPDQYKSDYTEACNVLPTSAKASAALTRRLLQLMIHDMFGIDKGNLNNEIGLLLGSVDIPKKTKDLLDAVRVIGNFAAHPEKSTNGGAIIDVEPAEADVNLETIEDLFDYCFNQPKIHEDRMRKINEKLKDSGRDPLNISIAKRASKIAKKK